VPDTAPEIYSAFVQRLVDAEIARRASLEQKGTAVIASSGTLVTLLFGLVAVVTGAKTFTLPPEAVGPLKVSIVLFLIAIAAALLISFPLPYGETEMTTNELRAGWVDTPSDALAAVAGVQVKALAAAREWNGRKAVILIVAALFQLAALVALGIAVFDIVSG
jgi:hypothetical protein